MKINLKFGFKLGKTPKETYAISVRVYENQAQSMKCVCPFSKSRESVSANNRTGKLATSVNDENIEKVRNLITEDPQLTMCMIARELQINRESVRQIVTKNLGMIVG
ncbi:uncharacterized protein TNCV_3708231 [Trichonephila clavipes]|nr:uncharacterized protein TNCV_3708231 [Trichonephila clavipes]